MIRVGSVTLQLSQPRQPCWKLARRWRRKDLAAQVERNGRTKTVRVRVSKTTGKDL